MPLCVVSGKHLTRDDWCFCPITRLPALYSEYVNYIQWHDEKRKASAAKDGEGGEASLTSLITCVDVVAGRPVTLDMLSLASEEEIDTYLNFYDFVGPRNGGGGGGAGQGGDAMLTPSAGAGGAGAALLSPRSSLLASPLSPMSSPSPFVSRRLADQEM